MSNLAAVIAGLALASILVAAVSVRRDEARPATPIAFEARLEMDVPPVMPKADRLPLPVAPEPEPPLLRTDPIPIAVAQLKQLKQPAARADPVCGSRGRTWYTKDNGWRAWKCNR
jgi:hypothetical protein